MRFRFRDKLMAAFAGLLVVAFVPALWLVNTQIESVSRAAIARGLQNTRTVFERYQRTRSEAVSDKIANFVLTQPIVRAEIASTGSDIEGEFKEIFGAEDPSADAGSDAFGGGAVAGGGGGVTFGALPAEGAPAAQAPGQSADGFGGAGGAFDAPQDGAGGALDAPQENAPAGAAPSNGGDVQFGALPSQGSAQPGGDAARGDPAETARALPERQGRLLSILEEVSLYQDADVFFITDFRGNLLFNKADPARADEDLTSLTAVIGALQSNPMTTWWASTDPAVRATGLLPASAEPRLYQLFVRPLIFEEEVRGAIAVGYGLTDADLTTITDITQSEIAFEAQGRIFRTSSARVPADALLALPDEPRQGRATIAFAAADEDFLALAVPVVDSTHALVGRVIVFRSETQERRAFAKLQVVLNAIGAAALALAIVLAFLISRRVGVTIRQLAAGTKAVQQGDLDVTLDIQSRDEFGDLGTAFNEMTAGLREKEAIRNTFARYASSSVVEELLRQGEDIRLGGENRVLTIQFSDIAGFTTISEQLSAEELVGFLNEYLTDMTGEIEREGGVVDKYIGDAVMAFWGAPVPLENTAMPACRAALRQLERLRELHTRWAERPELGTFDIRIGLHTGEVVVGNMGSHSRMDYTVMGDAVNTASRMEGLNKAYGTHILITEATRQAAGEAIVVRELDLVRPVGKTRPVRIYELVALAGEASPSQQALAEAFRCALEDYRAGRFAQALGAFEALAREQADAPSAIFAARCRALLADPPGDAWDGVYVSESK